MFNWFKKDKSSNVIPFPDHRDYGVADKEALPVPEPVRSAKKLEHYRIGFDEGQQMVTLTLMTDSGTSMTLSMNVDACEKMIRMLRAAYPEEFVE